MQPTLITARLVIRPVALSDADALWGLWTDPDVRRFLWDDREISRDEAAATVADCIALGAGGLGLWVLTVRDTNDPSLPSGPHPIGCVGLLPVTTAAEYEPRLAGLVEPLVALAPNAWFRGYAQEALVAVMSHASATLGLPTLAGVTDVPNVASDRMLRRAGFTVLSETTGPRYQLRTYLWHAPRTEHATNDE